MGYIKKKRTTKDGNVYKHGYRFWNDGRLYEHIGYDDEWGAREAEIKKRNELGITKASVQDQIKSSRFAQSVDTYIKLVVNKHINARHERYIFSRASERWGTQRLHAITSGEAEQFKQELLDNGSSPATANRYLAYLTAFYAWAGKRKMVPEGYNPFSGRLVAREPEPPREHPDLTPEIRQRILDAYREHPIERVRLILMMNTGVRKGVLYGLRWNQIDFTNETLTYETRKGRDRRIKRFTIPLNQTVLDALKGLRLLYEAVLTVDPKKAKALGVDPKLLEKLVRYPEIRDRIARSLTPEGPVFITKTDTALRKEWARVKAELGLQGVRLAHDYRVTFAKDLSQVGTPIREIQDLLGHTTPTMTLRYIPPVLEVQRKAVRKLDRMNGASDSRTNRRTKNITRSRSGRKSGSADS